MKVAVAFLPMLISKTPRVFPWTPLAQSMGTDCCVDDAVDVRMGNVWPNIRSEYKRAGLYLLVSPRETVSLRTAS